MPDQKTAYGGVDASNGAFYKMVANTAGDLSGGSLYCARMSAQSGATTSFDVNWVSMASTTDAAVLALVNTTLGDATVQVTFDDIFLTALPTSNVSGACPTGFTSTNTGYTYTVSGVKYYNECLQLNSANANAALLAAVLETPRYAGMLGCTTEFNKWEGITFSKKRSQMYTALSYWSASAGMSPSTNAAGAPNLNDIGGSQDLNIPYNANYSCGCVFSLNVDAQYSVNSMAPMVCGIALPSPDPASGSTCSSLGLSSPDNVAMMEDFGAAAPCEPCGGCA
jgi:hypothetical protein